MSSRPVSETVRFHTWSVAFSCGALLLPLVGSGQPLLHPIPSPSVAAAESEVAGSPAAVSVPVDPLEKNAFQAISREVQTIFNKSRGAVVRVEATDAFGPRGGTGFFIDPAGTIYTNYSVAGRSWNLLVEFAGKKYPATCLVADPLSGVVLLNIHATQTPFLPIGRSADLKMASPVVAIGYPRDKPESAAFGLVSGFDQKILDCCLPVTHIQANLPMQYGESGAPLLNANGEVVGIVMCQLNFGAACLSIPIRAAEKVRTDYLRFGQIRPAWMGFNVKQVTGYDEENDVNVERLTDSSPAAAAGLKAGDTLRKVGATSIHSFADLCEAFFFLTPDENVSIAVEREGKDLLLNVRTADPPGESMSLPPATESSASSPTLTLPMPRDPK